MHAVFQVTVTFLRDAEGASAPAAVATNCLNEMYAMSTSVLQVISFLAQRLAPWHQGCLTCTPGLYVWLRLYLYPDSSSEIILGISV
jgi:hypothetical protein